VDKFGPFAAIVTIAFALVAVVAAFIPRMLGKLDQWTYLVSDSPTFLVRTGAQIAAVALIGVSFVFITERNYLWFLLPVIIVGIAGTWCVVKFDRMRKEFLVQIPKVGENGQPLVDAKGNPQTTNLVIGDEDRLLPAAAEALKQARIERPVLSIIEFMSGYGGNQVNRPDNLWSRKLLAKMSNQFTYVLILIILAAVLALFWAALVISVANVSPTGAA
jgi:hypothetical protein